MASKLSKNSRTVSPMGNKTFSVDPNQRLIMSCNKGQHAYVFDVANTTNVHAPVGSDQFWAAIDSCVAAGMTERLTDELAILGANNDNWAAIANEFTARETPVAA